MFQNGSVITPLYTEMYYIVHKASKHGKCVKRKDVIKYEKVINVYFLILPQGTRTLQSPLKGHIHFVYNIQSSMGSCNDAILL